MHEVRMRDVFRQRQGIVFSGIMTLVMAVMAETPEAREKVIEQVRRLADEMFPGTDKERKEREERLAEILKTQAEKTLTVEQLFEGTDDG